MKENDPKKGKKKVPTDTPNHKSKRTREALTVMTRLSNSEPKTEARLNTTTTIANEKAMSQSKSPGRSSDRLVPYMSPGLDDNE
jgi:hypothetical protein